MLAFRASRSGAGLIRAQVGKEWTPAAPAGGTTVGDRGAIWLSISLASFPTRASPPGLPVLPPVAAGPARVWCRPQQSEGSRRDATRQPSGEQPHAAV